MSRGAVAAALLATSGAAAVVGLWIGMTSYADLQGYSFNVFATVLAVPLGVFFGSIGGAASILVWGRVRSTKRLLRGAVVGASALIGVLILGLLSLVTNGVSSAQLVTSAVPIGLTFIAVGGVAAALPARAATID